MLALTVAAQSSGEETTQVVTTSNVDVTDPPVDDEPKYCFKCSASIGLDFIREEGLPCFTPDDETKTIESQGCCYTGLWKIIQINYNTFKEERMTVPNSKKSVEDMPLNEIEDVSPRVNTDEKLKHFQGDHDKDEDVMM